LRAGVTVFKGAFLLCLTPKDFVIAIRVEGRVNVNQVNAGIGKLFELVKIVTAISDASVNERGRFQPGMGNVFFMAAFFCHALRLDNGLHPVNSAQHGEQSVLDL
jgi:hypothetical protein